MSEALRVVSGVLAIASLWAIFVLIREGPMTEALPLVMMVGVFGAYAIRGSAGQDPVRGIPKAQAFLYVLLVVAAFVFVAVGNSKNWW